jgi:hypothetical protein
VAPTLASNRLAPTNKPLNFIIIVSPGSARKSIRPATPRWMDTGLDPVRAPVNFG